MSHTRVLLAAVLMLLASSVARVPEPQTELNLIAWLDQMGRQAPPELQVSRYYYEVFDIDFAQEPIRGHVQLQALKTRDGREERLLDSPSGGWTRHLSARLFKDEMEVVPADYEIRFAPAGGRAADGSVGPVVVGKDRPVEATFTLSGLDGAPLEPGIYRLWIMLDMRDLPPAPGLFRGFAVDDAGTYYLHGEPDPARKGGLVFRVYEVGSDPALKARSLLQRAAREEAKASTLEARPLKPGDPPADKDAGARQRRKVVELALEGLRANPHDLELMVMLVRNYVVLNQCDAAVPYIKEVEKTDPNLLRPGFYHDSRMMQCISYAGEVGSEPSKH
jgi:hypothetical protein